MKAHTKAPKTTAAKSAKADKKSQDLKLPLAVYLRYRYRLALQANNLGKAKGLANRLAKLDEKLVVKGETFTTNAGALKFQESLETPKPKAKTSTKSKTASTKQNHNLKDLVLEIMALNIDIADKATLLAKLV